MLRMPSLGFLRADVIWFAEGEYSPELHQSPLAYFRQHRLSIPRQFLLSDERFHTAALRLDRPVEELRRGLTETLRYEIRRAERDGIEVTREPKAPRTIRRFLDRLTEFQAQKQYAGTTLTTEEMQAWKDYWALYTARLDGQPLVDLLVVEGGGRARVMNLISDLAYPSSALRGYAAKATVWKSIVDAKEAGLQLYDFGGVAPDPNDPLYGITRFKMSFGGTLLTESTSLVAPSAAVRLAYRLLRKRRPN